METFYFSIDRDDVTKSATAARASRSALFDAILTIDRIHGGMEVGHPVDHLHTLAEEALALLQAAAQQLDTARYELFWVNSYLKDRLRQAAERTEEVTA